MNIQTCFAFLVLLWSLIAIAPVQAQELSSADQNVVQSTARALDARTLAAGDKLIYLWGINAVSGGSPSFELSARIALEDLVTGAEVHCEIKARGSNNRVRAQCLNKDGLDLALYMLQQGYLVVDRPLVHNTVYEDPYIAAEKSAQTAGTGVWADSPGSVQNNQGPALPSYTFIGFSAYIGGLFLMLTIVIVIMTQKLVNSHERTANAITKDKKLKERERYIVASLLDAEIKANKSKIEAFLSIYQEMMNSLSDETAGEPKYKTAGDMVQEQPQLTRTVFDANVKKLEVLGHRVASDMSHFYARIKTNPDYHNLEPSTPIEEARQIVKSAVENAQLLNEKAELLIDAIHRQGLLNVEND